MGILFCMIITDLLKWYHWSFSLSPLCDIETAQSVSVVGLLLEVRRQLLLGAVQMYTCSRNLLIAKWLGNQKWISCALSSSKQLIRKVIEKILTHPSPMNDKACLATFPLASNSFSKNMRPRCNIICSHSSNDCKSENMI